VFDPNNEIANQRVNIINIFYYFMFEYNAQQQKQKILLIKRLFVYESNNRTIAKVKQNKTRKYCNNLGVWPGSRMWMLLVLYWNFKMK